MPSGSRCSGADAVISRREGLAKRTAHAAVALVACALIGMGIDFAAGAAARIGDA